MSVNNNAPEAARVIPQAEKQRLVSGEDEEMKQLLDEVARSLPPRAVRDLLSLRVCSRCIFRLLGVQKPVYACSSLLPSIFSSVLESLSRDDKNVDGDGTSASGDLVSSATLQKAEAKNQICSICLGILQFIYSDDKEIVFKKNSSYDMALSIAELVKKQGHQVESFSLEISIPPVILENEEAIRLYMKRNFGAEIWYQELPLSQRISVKDALRLSIANQLGTLLDARSGVGSFRIRLTYACSKEVEDLSGSCKRRKIGAENASDAAGNTLVADSGLSSSLDREFNGQTDPPLSDCVKTLLQKVEESCRLTISCYRTPIYMGGRYLKYSRNVSQTRWIIEDERMGEASVEEIIGSSILPLCQADNYKFHAAGREDIDVRMLGSGRPFLVEIQNARHIPSEKFVKEVEAKINNLEAKLIGVKNMKLLDNQGWDLMREGEAEKQKQYAALVWISRPVEDEDLQSISSLKDMKILQMTPVRVLHRRSPLEREKIIHWMKIEKIAGTSQYFLLHLCTQAGTYIKEFVHGDLGRTHPSIGSILGCRAEILRLDVTDVKMDCFLDG